ncbi:MAG: hypothetical protein ACRCWM_12790 [Sarcina sp.]
MGTEFKSVFKIGEKKNLIKQTQSIGRLPICTNCLKNMTTWKVDSSGNKFCTEKCINEYHKEDRNKHLDVIVGAGLYEAHRALFKETVMTGVHYIKNVTRKITISKTSLKTVTNVKAVVKPQNLVKTNTSIFSKFKLSNLKNGLAFGAGFSIGSNIVDLVRHKKTFKESWIQVLKDSLKGGITSYIVGILIVLVGKTYIGEEIKYGFTYMLNIIHETYIGKVSFDFILLIGQGIKGILERSYIADLINIINSTYIGRVILNIIPILLVGILVGASIKGLKLIFEK